MRYSCASGFEALRIFLRSGVTMKSKSTRIGLAALGAVLLVGLLALVGCQNRRPEVKQAVYSALTQHDLRTVEVFENRNKGEITLRGIVASADNRATAEQVAQQAAPGYTIKDQIQVQSAGIDGMVKSAQKDAKLDSAIEDNFKASLQSSKRLEKQDIKYSADNGTLYLKGSVKTEREKKEAEDLAKKVPQVKNVVNDLAVKPS
jgi:osmotically-inducible protein OsmY